MDSSTSIIRVSQFKSIESVAHLAQFTVFIPVGWNKYTGMTAKSPPMNVYLLHLDAYLLLNLYIFIVFLPNKIPSYELWRTMLSSFYIQLINIWLTLEMKTVTFAWAACSYSRVIFIENVSNVITELETVEPEDLGFVFHSNFIVFSTAFCI